MTVPSVKGGGPGGVPPVLFRPDGGAGGRRRLSGQGRCGRGMCFFHTGQTGHYDEPWANIVSGEPSTMLSLSNSSASGRTVTASAHYKSPAARGGCVLPPRFHTVCAVNAQTCLNCYKSHLHGLQRYGKNTCPARSALAPTASSCPRLRRPA